MNLTGKVALVTGTAGGQGLAAAELFVEAGAVVVGCDLAPIDGSEPIDTPATRGDLLADDHPMRRIAEAIPLGRVGRPEEVARCARFLASDEASYVTGVNLVIDGGWSAVLPGVPA